MEKPTEVIPPAPAPGLPPVLSYATTQKEMPGSTVARILLGLLSLLMAIAFLGLGLLAFVGWMESTGTSSTVGILLFAVGSGCAAVILVVVARSYFSSPAPPMQPEVNLLGGDGSTGQELPAQSAAQTESDLPVRVPQTPPVLNYKETGSLETGRAFFIRVFLGLFSLLLALVLGVFTVLEFIVLLGVQGTLLRIGFFVLTIGTGLATFFLLLITWSYLTGPLPPAPEETDSQLEGGSTDKHLT
jgi:hypothetical protein